MSSELIFKSLEFSNFLSFGQFPAIVTLTERGTVMVLGDNRDQSGSNGCGKTSIINALCYAIYNKAFDQISLQKLINSTNALKNTQMWVRLVFEKDNCEYEVFRSRGAEYRIEILKDGVDITPGKGAIECDAILQDIIGISYELFTKTIIFSGNSQAFLQLPLHQQRNIIEELFNITLLSEKATLLKEKIKSTEENIKIQEAICKQQEGSLELQRKHLVEACTRISRFDEQRLSTIEELKDTLMLIGNIDFDVERALHTKSNILKQKISELSAKIVPLKRDEVQLNKDVTKLLSEHIHLTDAKCPYCEQAYADAPEKIKNVSESIDTKGDKLIETEALIASINTELQSTKSILEKVQSEIQYQELDELLEARDNLTDIQKKLQDLEKSENPHIEAYEKLKEEAVVSVDYQKADNLRKDLDHQQFLLKLLTDKNSFLRRRIINKSIPFLNARLNHFTSLLGLPHIVKFDADMSCTVSEYGRELDFGNLSAGEKKRVNTSLMLAFRDVMYHLHAKVNLLMIDELDGALDIGGIDCIVKVLKEKSRDEGTSIFVISHHPAIIGRLDSSITIVKEQGFSSIVDESS
jgi:DNA repair exonuclease SbcCD ATPase subunit